MILNCIVFYKLPDISVSSLTFYILDLMTASLWSQLNHILAPYISWKLEVRSKALTIQCLVPHTASSLEV